MTQYYAARKLREIWRTGSFDVVATNTSIGHVAMFAKAVTAAAQFTRPVLISLRLASGKIETGCGSFVLLNSDGWILTAAHILGALLKCNEDKPKYEVYRRALQGIEGDAKLAANRKRQKLKALEFDPAWITDVSYWWGKDNVAASIWHFDSVGDVAAAKLINYPFAAKQRFAKFGDPSIELPQGKSLCKLGFPFHEFKTDFNEATSQFVIGELPALVRYPLDGILTRYITIQSPDGKRTVKYVEMSTPGLRGQSGGPWVDVNGTVWGMQSRTHHLPLGFSPELELETKKVTEHQFLNAGLATYVTEVDRFLHQHSIKFERV